MKTRNFAPYILIALTYLVFGILMVLPIYTVFSEALAEGFSRYWTSITTEHTLLAISLTVKVTFVSVVLNTFFGVITAFTITRFQFPGKNILLTIIDIPFSVSPVVAGLIFLLLFGRQGYFGDWLSAHDIKIVFNTTGLIIATVFITFPFVTRELIPIMMSYGKEEEEAGMLLGANIWQTFIRIILPNLKWGLMYGIILCNARAMGEFGAVSVLSGHIRGKTTTLPLHIEMLYNEFDSVGAFASASLLVFLSLLTLVFKIILEKRKSNAN